MEERPFRPARPVSVGDQEARLAASTRRVRRRRATRAAAAAGTVIAAAAIVLPITLSSSDGRSGLTVIAPPTVATTVPPPPTSVAVVPDTVPPATTVPSPTTLPPVTATTIPPVQPETGTITGPDGAPVAGAYLINTSTLQVYRTDSQGKFTLPYCVPVAQLYAASWLLPIGTSYPVPGAKPGNAGGSTTWFGPPPSVSGPGYVTVDKAWTGAASDPTPCQGQHIDFQVPSGGAVDIAWMKKSSTGNPIPLTGPIQGYYEVLPGLPYWSGTYVPTADSSGHQVISQLGSGLLAVNTSSVPFTCTGAGVTPAGGSMQVSVVAGQITHITCLVT